MRHRIRFSFAFVLLATLLGIWLVRAPQGLENREAVEQGVSAEQQMAAAPSALPEVSDTEDPADSATVSDLSDMSDESDHTTPADPAGTPAAPPEPEVAIVVPEANYRVNDPFGIVSPVAKLVANGEELDRRELAPDERGRPGRLRLIRTEEFKHPFLRVEERFSPFEALPDGPLNPFPDLIVSVANHALVQFDAALTREEIEERVDAMGGTIDEFTLSPGLVVVELPEPTLDAMPEAVAKFPELAEVRFAEANYVVGHLGGVIPNDPDWNQLWGMRKIDMPEAWQITTGNREIVVAVIDSGVDYTHPDLKDNMDHRGYDFYANNSDPMDENRHGTHVAGTVAAVGNNNLGVVGVAWETRIMGIRFLGRSGGGTTAGGINSIRYATQKGVDMTNNSWGGGGFSEAMYEAIEEARDAGILFVAAAGNDGSAQPGYPARYGNPGLPGGFEPLDNIIIVAASSNNEGDTLASFSQRNAHLAAPGVGIYSTVLGTGYQALSGTSMASPHVAGAAALLLAVEPNLTYTEVKDALLMYVDDRSADPLYNESIHSKGRLNVFNSLSNIDRPVMTHVETVFVESVGLGSDPVRAGNGVINPGETVDLTLSLRSVGIEDAYNVSATLSSTSSNITIDPAHDTHTYGNFDRFQTEANTSPFVFTVDANTETPYQIPLTLTINFTDGVGTPYESVRTFNLMVYTSVDVSGVVRHLDGSPFDGAQVVYTGPFSGSATTGSDGAFTFEMVDGTYRVFADAEGHTRSATREYTAPPGTTDLNFVLGNRIIESSVAAIEAEALPGGQVTVTLDLSNIGNLPLDWQLRETEYDFEHIIDAMDEDGNSLDPERPELGWKEIRTEYGGEGGRRHDWFELYRPAVNMSPSGMLGFHGQPASSAAMMFDFDFPYYGQTFRSARVQGAGWLSFNETSRSIFQHNQQRLPQLTYTPYMIAFQWSIRSEGGSGTNGWIHRKPHSNDWNPGPDEPFRDTRHGYSKNWDPYTWVFTWNQFGSIFSRTPTEFDTGQIELRSDGSIIMRYLKYELAEGVTEPTYELGPVFFQVGMQDGSRTRGLSPMFMGYTAYEENLAPWPGSVLIMHPAVAAGWIHSDQARGRLSSLEGQTTLTLTLDATQLPEGVYESSIVVDSDDSAGNEALRIPITFTVTETAPGVAITTPSEDGTATPGDDLTLTATVNGSADPAEVTFLNEGVEIGSATIDGSTATWIWEDIPPGFHELRARVTSSATGHTVYSPIRKIEAGQGLRVRLEFEDQPMQSLSVVDPISTLFQPPVLSYNRATAERFDIQPILFNEEDFTWLGSESSRDEWRRGEHVSVSSDGTHVRFVDRNYRKHPIEYTITEDTVLEFDLLMHRYTDSYYWVGRAAIGLLNDDSVDESRMFSLDYPNRNFGILDFADYTERRGDSIDPVFVKYRIPVGQYYTGDVSYLGFIGAGPHASSGSDTDVVLRNVRIFENSTSGDFTFNWTFNDTDRVVDTADASRTYFSPGTKEIQVEVSDGYYTNTASRIMEIPGEDTFRVAIDFGVPRVKIAGNLKDTGEAFGDRGNDLRFGWDRDRTADTMDDNVWNFTGMLQTRDFIRAGSGAVWRMEVPNGVYTVTAYVGRNFANTNNLLRFNGETLINRNLTNGNFYENSLTLPVTDGEIVISSHRNTACLTHLHIVRVRSVNAEPVASFTVTPQTGDALLEVNLDASDSFDSDGVIVHYDWDFGDGFGGEGQQLSHTYTQPGVYEVTLTVTDNEGFVGQAFASVVVTGDAQPGVLVTPPPMGPPLPPLFGEPQIQPYPSLHEDGGSLSYSIRLATQPTADVTVSIGSGDRVDANPQTLTFTSANWNTPQEVILTAVDDEIVNGTTVETITASAASSDTSYDGLNGAPFNVTVFDNDAYGTLQFTQSAITVDEDIGTFELTVTRVGGQSGTLTANWTTVNGTATGGEDFVADSGTLTWAHNETGSKTIPITIIDDEEPEPAEHFQVQITSATNEHDESVLGSPSAVTITILDNDNINPAIILNTPADGATFESGDVVTLSADVLSSTANITAVRFYVDEEVVHTMTAPTAGDTYSFEWTVQLGTSSWRVEADDNNEGFTESEVRNFTVTPISFGSAGGFLREIFTDITGTAVAHLTDDDKYPAHPDTFTFVETGRLSYQDNSSNYGTRHRAYFVAPKTGQYRFWVAARDRAELWLSTDISPHNAVRIIQTNNHVNPDNWTGNNNQRSAFISLEEGQHYYLEALHKAGTSNTRHIQVGVELPGGQMERPIPVGLLRPFEGSHLETTTELVRVPEGGSEFFGVRLSYPPYDQVRVDVTAEDFIDGGDSITVEGGSPMYFNDSNYDVWQFVRLDAAIDEDAIDGERTIRMTLDNGLYWEITAQEIDAQLNHTPEVEIESPTVATVNLVDKENGLWLEAWAWDPDGDELTITWSKESGPGTVTFDDANALDTGARFSEDGTYVLRITVSDGEFTVYDEVTVRINEDPIRSVNINTTRNRSYDITDSTWTLTGGGKGDMVATGNDHSMHFVYNELVGDFDVQARRVTAPERHNSRTALHVRNSLDPASAFVAIVTFYSPWEFYQHWAQARQTDGGLTTGGASMHGFNTHGWARIRREGNWFRTYTSTDGSSWTSRVSYELDANESVLVGIMVANGDDSANLVTAEWEHVTIPVTPQAGTAPQVSAGTNFTVDVNEAVQLDGSAEDDGLPDGTLHTMWRRIAGPAPVGVSDPDDIYDLDPTVTFTVPGFYTMRLLATDGEVTTFDDITVTVNSTDPAPPTITVQPEPQLVPVDGVASFSVTALAYPAATYQWFRVGDPDALIDGATESTLVIDPVQESDAGEYYLVVTNEEGSVTSDTVSLSILYPPSTPTGLSAAATAHNAIALSWTDPTDPSDLTDGFRLEVSDTGAEPWTLVAEPTGTTYTHTGRSPETTYHYRVRAFNAAGPSDWSAVAYATTPEKLEETFLINFGDAAYTQDPSGLTWQSFRLRQTAGTDSPKLEHTNVLLSNTEGDDAGGVRFSATSSVSNNMGFQGDDVVLESFFDANPFDWFTPSEGPQREVPAFNQSGSYWEYTLDGFDPNDEVTVEIVIRRPGSNRPIDLILNPGQAGEEILLANADSTSTQYVSHTATGSESYTFRLTSKIGNWVGTINAMSVTVAASQVGEKETPDVTAWPTASEITFGQTLADVQLDGGTAVNNLGQPVAGTFAFVSPSVMPPEGTASHDVRFIPALSTLYSEVPGTVSVTVLPAPEQFTVSYEANGGSGSVPDAHSHEAGETVTVSGANGLTRSGYLFIGWNTAADGSGTAYDPEDTFTMPEADVVLYAQWDELLSIHFTANGASGQVPDPLSALAGISVTLPGPGGLSKAGHAFNGWRDVSGAVTYAEGDTLNMPEDGLTLVAQWTVLGGEGVYLQTFDNTVNRALITTLTNWGYAAVNGAAPAPTATQWGMLSDANGAGGTPGLAYNIGANGVRGFATWFAGDLETPTDAMNLAQSALVSLSARIGHTTANNQTRWLMRIDDDGTDRWFVSLATYTNAVGGVDNFEANNIQINANFADLEWRPLLNPDGDGPFDGLIGAASDGFTLITNAANPTASTLPAGNITALGVYHWHNANDVTRFDDFKVTWGSPGGGHTVTYDAGEGTGTPPADTNQYAEASTITVMGQGNLIRAGHSFLGWRDEVADVTYAPLDTFDMPDRDVTLVAQWEALDLDDFGQWLEDNRDHFDSEAHGETLVTRSGVQMRIRDIWIAGLDPANQELFRITGWDEHGRPDFAPRHGDRVYTTYWTTDLTADPVVWTELDAEAPMPEESPIFFKVDVRWSDE